MQKRFVSWAAVSSLPQAKKISLSDQLQTNKRHIEQWEGTLVEELIVPGESRSIVLFEDAARKMTAYARLKELIERRAFDVLIYLDRSRLGRKAPLSMAVIELCHEAGILTYPTESPPTSLDPEQANFHNRVVGAIESVLAQEEVTKIQRRHEMGMAARVRNGEFPNKIPYGWNIRFEVDGEKPKQIIEVDEEAKEIIILIYSLFLHGSSVKTVSEKLIEEGYPQPRGERWTESAVTVILNLAMRYAGIVELNVRSSKRPYIRAQLRWPALIDEDLAKEVMAERARRAKAPRSIGRGVHRFSQLVWCKPCQRRMIAHHTWRPSRKDKSIVKQVENYRCMYSGKADHDKYQIGSRYLIDAVEKAIIYVQDEANRKRLLEEYVDRRPEIKRNIEKATARLDKLDEAAERADDAYVMGKMTIERYQRQIDNLDDQRADISAEIEALGAELEMEILESQREARLIEMANEGSAMLKCADLAAANAWFRRHIRLWVDNNNPKYRVIVEYL